MPRTSAWRLGLSSLRSCWTAALAAACLPLMWATPALADGDLQVAPTRVVLENGARSAAVTVKNTGTRPGIYRISFERRRMTETGEFREVLAPQADELSCADFVRFSPRQVELAPGEAQVVRLVLRKPAVLEAGEYRSHLMFRAVPAERPEAERTTGLDVRLTAVFGISIPVMVREGQTAAQVALAGMSLEAVKGASTPVLSLEARRTGNRSVYGDFIATFIPHDAQPVELARVRGLAVYTPNALRRVRLPLVLPAGTRLTHGRLHVSYVDPLARGPGPMGEAELVLP